MAFRDTVGRFLPRQAQAAPVGAEAVEEPAALDDQVLLPVPVVLAEIARVRAERTAFLRSGNVAAVRGCDDEIARLKIGLELAEAQAVVWDEARARHEWQRRRQAWLTLRPRLEAAQARRDRAAFELRAAIDAVVALENEATALGVEPNDRTPLDPPYTQYLFDKWIGGHLDRAAKHQEMPA